MSDGELIAQMPRMADLLWQYQRPREAETVWCPTCGTPHPETYKLVGCGVRHCDNLGCHLCFGKCQSALSHGRFCDLHLNAVEMGTPEHPLPILCCLECERESFEGEAA